MPNIDLQRARRLMKENGINALIASSPANFYYASGFRANFSARPGMVVLPSDNTLEPAALIPNFHERQAKQKSYIQDIRTYPWWLHMVELKDILEKRAKPLLNPPTQFRIEEAYRKLTEIILDKGLSNGVIGIERTTFSPKAYSLLLEMNPKAQFVDAEGIFFEIKKVKSPGEIEAIRQAVELTEKGIMAMIQGGVAGSTIGDLNLKYRKGVLDALTSSKALDFEFVLIMISAGDHFQSIVSPNYRVSKGDILSVDLGISISGYNSDLGRTFIVGKPNDVQKIIFKALQTGFEAGLDKIKPGVNMREVYRAVLDTVRQNGLGWYTRGHMGHSIGVGYIEQPPFFADDSETILEPNMVLNLEVAPYVLGLGAFQTEEVILVTSTGHELITKLSRDMVEI
jgi:Xaa-Pro dipeptidase